MLKIAVEMIEKHNKLRDIFLESYDEDSGLTDSTFNLNKELKALIHFEYLNHDLEKKFFIEPKKKFCKEPLFVHGNRYEITGIFQNIITNSVDAMRNHPDIESHKLYIKTEKENDKAIITISDTGKGFPEADKNGKVKIEKIKSSKAAGGFGLVHIKYFIQQYKGTLEIHNRKKGGAAIKVTLPLVKEKND